LFALYFTGAVQDADEFRDIWQIDDSSAEFSHVFFARCVAVVRSGELAFARREWLRVYQRSNGARGWLFQAQAFFSMQQSRWKSAARWAERAAHASFADGDNLLRSIAFDMQAHAAARLGNFSIALRQAQRSLECAKLIGNTAIENAVRVSLACWDAERGSDPQRSLRTLRSLLKEKSFHDSHSQSVLLLELSRLLILRGEFSHAHQALVRIERTLTGSGGQPLFRQRIQLAQRKALLLRLSGRPDRALQMLEQVYSGIPEFEKSLRLEVRGQMITSAGESGMSVPETWLSEESQLTAVVRTERALRTLRRRQAGNADHSSQLDDRLGVMVDELWMQRQSTVTREKILEAGWFALIVPRRRNTEEPVFYVLRGDEKIISATTHGIRLIAGKPTPQMLALLRLLADGVQTKQEIFKVIWNRRYYPERDDAAVYVLVGRLRKFLREDAHLLVSRHGGYMLEAQVQSLDVDNKSESKPFHQTTSIEGFAGKASVQPEDLPSVRILVLLEWSRGQNSFTAEQWQKHASLSRASACRDLAYCCSKGLLLRMGRGRALSYCSPPVRVSNSVDFIDTMPP
jgi:DNA-binding winged helix-turn-helix (wHTH) protein/tetratricopeptide (TPR) repeat protein